MNKLDILKSVTGTIVSIGAGAVVGNAIKMTTPEDVKTLNKICIGVGGFVLTSMVGGAASKYATDTIDETVEQFQAFKVVNDEED